MDAQMFTDVVKAAVGPFLGAGLAFLSTRIHDARRQHQENAAAGNIALTTLNSMLNEHYLWRLGVYADLANPQRNPDSPIWAMMRPSTQAFGDHQIDLKSLAFLFKGPIAIEALNAAILAQLRFNDMVVVSKFSSDTASDVLDAVSAGDFTSYEAAAKALGKQKIAKMIGAVESAVKRARDEESDYTNAYDKLRAALQTRLSFWWASDPWFVNRGPVQNHFRKENLPTLPPAVLQLMADFDQRSTEARAVPVTG